MWMLVRSTSVAMATIAFLNVTAKAEEIDPSPLEEFDRHAEQLGEQAKETIEEFLGLIGPLIDRFSYFVDDLPAYHAPEILPNGDIIIRRKHNRDLKPETKSDGEIDT